MSRRTPYSTRSREFVPWVLTDEDLYLGGAAHNHARSPEEVQLRNMWRLGKIQHEEVRDNSTMAEQGLTNALESLTEK